MLGLVCVTALVLAVVALSRTAAGGSLTERIAALEREVRQLRALLQAREAAPERAEKREPAPAAVKEPPQAVAPPAAPPFRERPAAPPPPAASAPRLEIDWEQLFGVRAAAGLGGVALALAGLLFFKYSIEHGLIPPWLRVVLGTLVGVACIAGSEWKLRRRYARTADALAGAGMVVLYAAFWAASIRYGLVPIPLAFVLMVAVTASGCVLSWRHTSQVIASLGLVGGFLTPLLLSTGADRPIGLFGYVLLLDTGLLYLARQRRWPVLALLSLAGTVFYQALWIGTRMGPDRLLLGLAILGAFALLFAVAPRLAGGEEADLEWLIAQAGGVLVPFAFVLYFASSTRLGFTSIRTASCSSRSRPPPAGSRGRSAPIGSGSARPRRRSPSWACGSSRARWGRGSRGRRRSGVCSSRSRSTFSSSGSGSRAARAARRRPPSSRASASSCS